MAGAGLRLLPEVLAGASGVLVAVDEARAVPAILPHQLPDAGVHLFDLRRLGRDVGLALHIIHPPFCSMRRSD